MSAPVLDATPTLDSFAIFTIVAERLHAEALGRVAQVSKALRVVADSNDSWQLSYGVSKAARKAKLDVDLEELARAKEAYRVAMLMKLAAEENVVKMTNELARAIIFEYPGHSPPLVMQFVGFNGYHYLDKRLAATSWEQSHEVQNSTCDATITTTLAADITLDDGEKRVFRVPNLSACERELKLAHDEYHDRESALARNIYCLHSSMRCRTLAI